MTLSIVKILPKLVCEGSISYLMYIHVGKGLPAYCVKGRRAATLCRQR